MSLNQLIAGPNSVYTVTGAPSPDVRYIHPRQRAFQIPEDGITIPSHITIPLVTTSKQNIIQFGVSIGLSMPTSYTKQGLMTRIDDTIRSLGYHVSETSPTLYIREKDLKLQLEGGTVREKTSKRESIHLPELIDSNIFNTIGSMCTFYS
jgi:hypothetical protein